MKAGNDDRKCEGAEKNDDTAIAIAMESRKSRDQRGRYQGESDLWTCGFRVPFTTVDKFHNQTEEKAESR